MLVYHVWLVFARLELEAIFSSGGPWVVRLGFVRMKTYAGVIIKHCFFHCFLQNLIDHKTPFSRYIEESYIFV